MEQCYGQMSLMEFFMSIDHKNEPPILLSEGQTVYKVVRGDIETHIVTGETWECGGGNRGYRLKRIDGCWDCTWNTQINQTVLTDLEAAKRVAELYLAKNEHILANDIHAIKVVAYSHKYNGSEIINFYATLKDGNVYYHYGSMYEHIGKKDEIKKFEEGRREYINSQEYAELENYQPEYANMYKCTKGDKEWIYAAARYEFI